MRDKTENVGEAVKHFYLIFQSKLFILILVTMLRQDIKNVQRWMNKKVIS